MIRFSVGLLCLMVSNSLGLCQKTSELIKVSPNEQLWSQDSLFEGLPATLFVRFTCKDKIGVELTFLDQFTAEVFESKFIPIKLGNAKCTPELLRQRYNALKIGTVLFPHPSPSQSFAALGRSLAPDSLGTAWIYVADNSAINSIEVLDPTTLATVASLGVAPRLVKGLVFSPDGRRLYATLWRSTSVNPFLPAQIAVIDTVTNQILDRITLTSDNLPATPAVSPDGRFLYFADPADGLVVVDLESRTIAQKIPATAAGGTTNQLRALSLSPDGGLICVTDNFGIALLDTRTRTFFARVNISLPNRDIAPVFHSSGSRVYVIDRKSVTGGLAVSLVGFDMSLTEVSRADLPSTFDPYHLEITPNGLSLAMDGFLRPATGPAKGVFILFDTTNNRVVATDDTINAAVGALGVVLH